MKKNLKDAFSLMEMMVVLLIVAIVAAATAPIVTKKMARSVGSGDSPWLFSGINGNIVYNMNKADVSAIIGSSSYSAGENEPTRPRLVLASGNDANHPALAFADQDGNFSGQITMNKTTGIVGLNNSTVGRNSVAIGMGQTIDKNSFDSVAIGHGVKITSNNSTAIGYNAEAGFCSVSIGSETKSSKDGAIAIGYHAHPRENYAVAIGYDAGVDNSSIAIGTQAGGTGNSSVAIGTRANGSGNNSVMIGTNARHISSDSSIAIGTDSYTSFSNNSIAIGKNAEISISNDAIAIGNSTLARHDYSTAIGAGAETTATHQIVLGTKNDTVYIPGHLVVDGNVLLSMQGSTSSGAVGGVYLREASLNHDIVRFGYAHGSNGAFHSTTSGAGTVSVMGKKYTYQTSDRSLKNVGAKYMAGLDELKKLDFYHYTFKKDEAKTPMVGVMAQDLQKVFPDAVIKGEDGYLRIRLEDMFYAVINAVKELDNKISSIKTTMQFQQETIEKLQKENAELKEEIKDIENRIKKLEN